MSLPDGMNAWLWYLGGNLVVERLFWASLEMAVLALAVGMVIAMARPASPRVRALLWLLVLAKPLAALALGPLYPVLIVEEPQVATLAVDPAPWDDGNRQLLTAPAVPPRPAPAAMQADTPARPWGAAWADAARRADPRQAGAALWGLLAGLMALHRALDAVRLRRLVRRGAAPSAACAALYAEAARGLGVWRPPRLVVTDEMESPALAGTLRPAVLLPAWLHTAGEPGVVSWALRHELMHWKLGDTLSNLVGQAARALFFFHPATWWAAARWEEEAELACDRALVSTPGEADAYAGTLYEVLAQMRGRRDRAFAGTLCATRTQIGKRIAALLANPLRCPARPGMWAVAGLLLLAAVALGTGGTFGGQVSADAPPYPGEDKLQKALDRPRSLHYRNEHLSDVLTRELSNWGVDFVLDWRVIAPPPRLAGSVEKWNAAAYATDGMVEAVDCQDIPLREALTKELLAPLGLAFESMEGVVWVSTPEQLRRDAADGVPLNIVPAPGTIPEWDRTRNQPMGLGGDRIHLQRELKFIANAINIPIVLDRQAVLSPSSGRPDVLYGPVGPNGVSEGASYFQGISPPAGTWLPGMNLNFVPARTALSCLLRPLNLVCVPKDGHLLVTARGTQSAAEKAAEPTGGLDRRVSLRYDNEHLADVLKRESKRHGVNFALDWRVIAPPPHSIRSAVTADAAYATNGMVGAVDCKGISLREALAKEVLAPLGLAYEIVGGVVWVSTPEQLRRDAADGSARNIMPAPGAAPEWDRALNAPTTIEFEDIPVEQVVEFIADSYDLPLVLDSQAVSPSSEGEIPPAGTWQPRVFLNDVPARTALSCMLRPLNLVCVPKDGHLLVTARGAQARAGKETAPALVRVRTLPSGVKRALIRDRDGGLHWYNEGARVGDFTVTEINAVKKTARLVADDGQWIHMVAETRDGAPEPAWTGPYVAFRWEARDGGGEEVPWAAGHGEGSLRLEPEALLTEFDVLRAAIKSSEDGRSQDVLLALRPASATSFGAATEAGVGRRLAIVFDGEIMLAPVVRSRITENVMITGLTVSEAQGVVESVGMAPKPGEEATAAAQAGEEKGPQYAVEARFFHVPRMGLAETVMSSPQWVNQMFVETRSQEDVRVFRFPDAEQVLKGLEKVEGTMLVSAPRCTFIPGKTPPKVLWRRDENRNPGPGDAPLRTLDALSPSFARFRAQTPPCVVMADLKTQPVSGEGDQEPLHEGVVFALAAGAAEPPAPLDATVYLNELRRGTASKMLDGPVTLRMPLAPGDAIAVVSEMEEPETVQLVLLTLSAVETPEEVVR